jgi:CheY-like chemotaxis protein
VTVATIVVVEDQPENLKLLTTLLSIKGHRVIGLASGDTLADVMRTHQPIPDLVLLDIELPGRDGYELLAELQTLPERNWKVVALTAHALPEDRERAAAAGFDGYITKPIDVRGFPAEVAKYLGG